MKHTGVCSALLILTVLMMAACGPVAGQSTQGPDTWLDEPLDGAKLPLGPTEIMAHASDSDGVGYFDFFVNGTLLARANAVAAAPVQVYSTGYSGAPGTAGYLASATVGWNPTTPGVYTIRAVATDAKGHVGFDATAVVTVGRVEGSPTHSPAVPPTEEIVAPGTPAPPVPTRTPGPPTPTPRFPTKTPGPPTPTPPFPTATPRPPTATPQPPARRAEIIYFLANPATINAGGCSTLSWDVQYAAAVYLDGEGVVAPDDRQVCPATTTTYTLYATSGGGDDQESVTVTVQQPHELTTDVAMTDLFPETPTGPLYGRLTNNGPDTLTNVTVQYQCQWDETDRIEIISHSYQVGPTGMTIISLSPGQTTPFNIDIPVDVTAYRYEITCRVVVDFDDPNLANNSYYEEFL